MEGRSRLATITRKDGGHAPRALLAHRPAVNPSAAPAAGELFTRLRERGDLAAREELATMFLPLARRLAQRYVRSSEPREDLVQVASVGLLKAIDRFDPDRGHNFTSFAIPTVLGELRRYFRDATWAAHVPRSAQERAAAIEAAQEELRGERQTAPTVDEIAEYLQISAEDVLGGLLASRAYEADSLDAPAAQGDDGDRRSGLEQIGAEDASYELIEADASAVPAIRELSRGDRRVLHMRFVEEMSQSDIAARIGVSQMQVSRILSRSLARLRELADAPAT
ncbi:MAG TPA: SigB/SigF/SigG family RNA polymerase sigma factor [Solirubrobacteraceae bacterium]